MTAISDILINPQAKGKLLRVNLLLPLHPLDPRTVVDTQTCVQVRNHILTRWRADVTRFLHEEDAGAKVQPKYQHLVSLAWRFLYTHGYINFGVAPAITQHPTPEQQVTVVVIGAGLAGEKEGQQIPWEQVKHILPGGQPGSASAPRPPSPCPLSHSLSHCFEP